jgi:hypothetical protein
MNDKQTFSIGILSLTAVVLFVANFMPLRTSDASTAIKERDFTLVTTRATQGGEGLYIVDNRTAMMAVFMWDNAARSIVLRDLRPIMDAFQ